MRKSNLRFFLALAFLAVFFPRLNAQDRRNIPMDFYMIIDGSEAFEKHRNEAIAWVNERVVDRLLLDGDRVSIWAAGDRAELVFSGDVSDSGGNQEIKDQLLNFAPTGRSADFSGALRNVNAGISGTSDDRLPYTILVTASAGGLYSALAGDTQGLLRWFRTEKSAQWQALVVAPDIGRKVNQAALAYMNSVQR